MKKIFFSFLIVTLAILFSDIAFASNSSDKDNVLIYTNKTGSARGYDLKWQATNITGTYAQESPILKKGNIVYVTSINRGVPQPGNRSLFALDAETGVIIDQYETGGSFGDARIDGNTLYIGTGNEAWDPDPTWAGQFGMYSFDISDVPNNGFVLNWFHEVPARIASNILVDNNNIYFTEFTGDKLLALAKNDGHQVWSFTKGSNAAMFSMLKDGFIYMTNSRNPSANLLYKIDVINGSQVWAKPIFGNLWDNSVTYSPDQNAFFFTAYFDGAGAARHRAASYDIDGNFLWEYELNDKSLSYASYHNNSVFFSDLSGWVYSLNAVTGALEWSTRIGKDNIHRSIDIASAVVSNGYVFVGTKGAGWYNIDTRGRGAFYILDEETGSIVWEYHEDDLGDVMSLATVVDGMFYNATNAWDVFAFDVGDGTSTDHLNGTYDENNTFSTETGLTQDRFVKLECNNVGDESTCNTTNSYTGRAVEVKVDMDTDVVESVLLNNGNYHINVDGSYVYMPVIPANGAVSGTVIKSSGAATYNPTIPHLVNIVQSDAAILESSYNPTNQKIVLSIDNTMNFDAEIKVFSKPFIGVKSISNNSSVIISKSGINGPIDIISADMQLTASASTIEADIYNWQNDYMKWNEKGQVLGTSSHHQIDNLLINTEYQLIIDGIEKRIFSDTNGEIVFDTILDDTLHSFVLKKYEKPRSGGRVIYVCKDEAASNYSSFGRHKQSKCEYDSVEEGNEDLEEIETSESNPFGGEQCSSDLIIHNFMKNGDTNGKYSNYNNGVITEVSILQAHINRLLADDYVQAAGPVDIWFRSLTHQGVKRIQVKLNQLLPKMSPLDIDGVVGPFTREAINMSC